MAGPPSQEVAETASAWACVSMGTLAMPDFWKTHKSKPVFPSEVMIKSFVMSLLELWTMGTVAQDYADPELETLLCWSKF